MEQPTLIRDPVHNYIVITPIEKSIVDRPVFQRLRFILQNSSAYQTYPGNTHTRFLHSLGVMHLSGALFAKALERSAAGALAHFLKSAEETILRNERSLEAPHELFVQGWQRSLGNTAGFSHQPLHGSRIVFRRDGAHVLAVFEEGTIRLEADPEYTINTCWQVLRLLGLIHDIGHFPMSHVFERAFNDFIAKQSKFDGALLCAREWTQQKERYCNSLEPPERTAYHQQCDKLKPHELLGLFLHQRIYLEEQASAGQSNDYYRLVNKLAKSMLLQPESTEQENNNAIAWLRSIVSGEIDSDRLDYCLRDPQSSGLEFHAIDVTRIVNSALLVQEGARFRLVYSDKALSAIESFFYQRYNIYKYLVYHHNVVRMDGVLKEIILRLLEIGYGHKEQSDDVKDLLDRYGYVAAEPDEYGFRLLRIDDMRLYDDSSLRSLLMEVSKVLKLKTENATSGSKQTPDWVEPLLLLVETFLYRISANLYSVWKRETQYQSTLAIIAIENGVEIGEVEELNPFVLAETSSEPYEKAKCDAFARTLDSLRSELEPLKVIIIYRDLRPKLFDEKRQVSVLVRNRDSMVGGATQALPTSCGCPHEVHQQWNFEYAPLGNASGYIKLLQQSIGRAPNIHLSLVARDLKSNRSLLQQCNELVNQRLAEYVSALQAAKPRTS